MLNEYSWENLYHKFYPNIDIFFSREYFQLFENKHSIFEIFKYTDGENVFYFPFLKNSISGTDYYDFQSSYGYSGPLSSTEELDFLKKAYSELVEYCVNKNIVAGFIRFHPLIKNHRLIDPDVVDVIHDRNVVILDVKNNSLDKIWSDYRKNNRNKIRKSLKNDVVVKEQSDLLGLFDFKKMYEKTMDRNNASEFYYFDNEFYKKLNKISGKFKVFFALKDEKKIGSALVLIAGNYMTYFLSATEKIGRKLGVSNLLRHHSIKKAKELNLEIINFGGGRTPNKNDSLMKFKLGFSNEQMPFWIGKIVFMRKEYDLICQRWMEKTSEEKINEYSDRVLKYRY